MQMTAYRMKLSPTALVRDRGGFALLRAYYNLPRIKRHRTRFPNATPLKTHRLRRTAPRDAFTLSLYSALDLYTLMENRPITFYFQL